MNLVLLFFYDVSADIMVQKNSVGGEVTEICTNQRNIQNSISLIHFKKISLIHNTSVRILKIDIYRFAESLEKMNI